MTDRVCSAHFLEKDLKLADKLVVNGEVVVMPRDRASLCQGALPLLFENYPPYYQPKINQRKAPPKRENFGPKEKTNKENVKVDLPESGPNLNEQSILEDTSAEIQKEDNDKPLDPPAKIGWIQTSKTSLVLPPDWIFCKVLHDDIQVVAHLNPHNIKKKKKKI